MWGPLTSLDMHRTGTPGQLKFINYYVLHPFSFCLLQSVVKRGMRQMKNYKPNYKPKRKKRHFYSAALPMFQFYITSIFILNAFRLFTAGPLTPEALESTSVIAITWDGFNMHQRKADFQIGKNQSRKYLYSYSILEKRDCLRMAGNCNTKLWN